jgi:hypothetical protein
VLGFRLTAVGGESAGVHKQRSTASARLRETAVSGESYVCIYAQRPRVIDGSQVKLIRVRPYLHIVYPNPNEKTKNHEMN